MSKDPQRLIGSARLAFRLGLPEVAREFIELANKQDRPDGPKAKGYQFCNCDRPLPDPDVGNCVWCGKGLKTKAA